MLERDAQSCTAAVHGAASPERLFPSRSISVRLIGRVTLNAFKLLECDVRDIGKLPGVRCQY